MRRLVALAAVVAAFLVPGVPASATHLCVTSDGRDVVCAPHTLPDDPRQICVTRAGDPPVCVP